MPSSSGGAAAVSSGSSSGSGSGAGSGRGGGTSRGGRAIRGGRGRGRSGRRRGDEGGRGATQAARGRGRSRGRGRDRGRGRTPAVSAGAPPPLAPPDVASLVGSTVRRLFEGANMYEGVVLPFDGDYYTVEYTDGDKVR